MTKGYAAFGGVRRLPCNPQELLDIDAAVYAGDEKPFGKALL